jgi:alkyl sulfatase BDS1-like metallo-beta-lactamase superfamily hydrolase
VQRYPKEWADALRAMSALEAEVLLPGHGVPVVGKERVRAVLEDGAALLESLVDQTLELMNAGASLDHIVNAVSSPEELVAKPYLRPIYDEPEFVVRNVWRLYGGWFDGNPAHLKPPADDRLGTEVARLAGGARVLAQRASELAAAGELRLACSLIEFAWLAEPADRSVAERRATIYEQRAAAERSTMSTGVFSWAARESTAAAEPT